MPYLLKYCIHDFYLKINFQYFFQTCDSAIGGVYNVVTRRRGQIFEEIPRPGTPIVIMKAYLPVSESFGKSSKDYYFLKSNTALSFDICSRFS